MYVKVRIDHEHTGHLDSLVDKRSGGRSQQIYSSEDKKGLVIYGWLHAYTPSSGSKTTNFETFKTAYTQYKRGGIRVGAALFIVAVA